MVCGIELLFGNFGTPDWFVKRHCLPKSPNYTQMVLGCETVGDIKELLYGICPSHIRGSMVVVSVGVLLQGQWD